MRRSVKVFEQEQLSLVEEYCISKSDSIVKEYTNKDIVKQISLKCFNSAVCSNSPCQI